jgi:hypothetical protein
MKYSETQFESAVTSLRETLAANASNYEEDEHPRGQGGKWTSKAGGGDAKSDKESKSGGHAEKYDKALSRMREAEDAVYQLEKERDSSSFPEGSDDLMELEMKLSKAEEDADVARASFKELRKSIPSSPVKKVGWSGLTDEEKQARKRLNIRRAAAIAGGARS